MLVCYYVINCAYNGVVYLSNLKTNFDYLDQIGFVSGFWIAIYWLIY